MGLIPLGWEVKALGEHANFKNGYAFKSKDWQDEGFPVVKIGSVKPGIVDIDKCSYVSPQTTTGLDKFELNEGDILVGMTGYPGETGIIPRSNKKVYLNQRVGRISEPQEHPHNYLWIY